MVVLSGKRAALSMAITIRCAVGLLLFGMWRKSDAGISIVAIISYKLHQISNFNIFKKKNFKYTLSVTWWSGPQSKFLFPLFSSYQAHQRPLKVSLLTLKDSTATASKDMALSSATASIASTIFVQDLSYKSIFVNTYRSKQYQIKTNLLLRFQK